jgi:hypothetical protein
MLDTHSLTGVNLEAKLADCAVCGPSVPIHVRVRDRADRRTRHEVQCVAKFNERRGPAERRKQRLRSTYNLTVDDYQRMYAEQQGRCAICLDEHPELAVDHDHESGAVRGLLCRCCNLALGYLRDNPGYLIAAIAYLAGETVACP